MGTPRKPVKKSVVAKNTGAKKSEEPIDPGEKKKMVDDEDDDVEFGMPLDDLGGYETFEGYDEDDDY